MPLPILLLNVFYSSDHNLHLKRIWDDFTEEERTDIIQSGIDEAALESLLESP